jgi:hypothetical protein
MILIANTHFPQFIFDERNKLKAPDLDETSCSESGSEDEAAVKQRYEAYKTKEDQDVAVFMNIAQRMDLNSLVFILQGHAKTMNLPVQAQQAAARKIAGQKVEDAATKPKPVKKFRFAEVNNHNVRCVIHVIPSVKDCTDMWWSEDDMKQIRGSAIQDVKYYRKYRKDFGQTVEILANSGNQDNLLSNQTVESHLKKMMEDSYARGLEVHIVNFLSDLRREVVKAVLDEQQECRMCGDSYELTAESLREQSVAYTMQSRTFAQKMAQCDQIEALKASLSSRWEAEGPSASATRI